jgi:PilZ domain-containing protein
MPKRRSSNGSRARISRTSKGPAVQANPAAPFLNVRDPLVAQLDVHTLAAPWCYAQPGKREMMASSVPSTPDGEALADRRVYPRVPVALPAFLQANGERHAVQILDLSPGGAKLECAAPLAAGTAVILDCGTLACGAAVRWQSGGAMGVCFDSELDAREASALIDRSRAIAARMKTRE